jgi:hypothetical protein
MGWSDPVAAPTIARAPRCGIPGRRLVLFLLLLLFVFRQLLLLVLFFVFLTALVSHVCSFSAVYDWILELLRGWSFVTAANQTYHNCSKEAASLQAGPNFKDSRPDLACHKQPPARRVAGSAILYGMQMLTTFAGLNFDPGERRNPGHNLV